MRKGVAKNLGPLLGALALLLLVAGCGGGGGDGEEPPPETAGAGLTEEFAPVVSSMTIERVFNSATNADELQFTAAASDDRTALADLTYIWGYTPDSSDATLTGSGATGTLSPYDETESGTVALSVTDTADPPMSTTVDFRLEAAMFPDDALILVFDFESGTLQTWSTTGLWHVTARKAAAGSSHSMWYGDEALGNAGSELTTGKLSLSVVLLGANPTLDFEYLHSLTALNTGLLSGCITADCPALEVEVTDGAGTVVGSKPLADNSAFTDDSVPITAAKGATITIDFIYDNPGTSGDTFEGPFIDNIRIGNR